MISKTTLKSSYIIYILCLTLSLLFINCNGGGGGGEGTDNPTVLSSEKNITSFSILGISGTIGTNTITLTLPNGTAVTSLVATFTTTGQTVTVGGVVQVSGTTQNNFTNSVIYTVTAEDSSTKTYTVTVIVTAAPTTPTNAIVSNHTTAADFNSIPVSAINQAKVTLHIAYGHTSHGSQLITGMNALAAWDTLYSWNNGGTGGALDLRDGAMGGDVGYYPDWVNNTRTYLGDPNSSTGRGTTNPDINVIIWSWCGQASGYTQQQMIDYYLVPMTQLEAEYPGIKFVYMTGHLDGGGEGGTLNLRNQQIRDYCTANNKILFDFADIESYDPNGATNYMLLNANDGCNYTGGNWAVNWIAANPGSELTTLANNCGGCAHSETLNCVLKGRAAWWLWARLAGWNP
jgi:hypothetical protein